MLRRVVSNTTVVGEPSRRCWRVGVSDLRERDAIWNENYEAKGGTEKVEEEG